MQNCHLLELSQLDDRGQPASLIQRAPPSSHSCFTIQSDWSEPDLITVLHSRAGTDGAVALSKGHAFPSFALLDEREWRDSIRVYQSLSAVMKLLLPRIWIRSVFPAS